MSAGQLRGQLAVVVDLTVEDHCHRAVFIELRLPATLNIDDRQAPVSQGDRSCGEESVSVRPPMRESARHPPNGERISLRKGQLACDATHPGSTTMISSQTSPRASGFPSMLGRGGFRSFGVDLPWPSNRRLRLDNRKREWPQLLPTRMIRTVSGASLLQLGNRVSSAAKKPGSSGGFW